MPEMTVNQRWEFLVNPSLVTVDMPRVSLGHWINIAHDAGLFRLTSYAYTAVNKRICETE